MSYQIQTYNPNFPVKPLSFFVLSKGLNSGRPLFEPCANCFVITTKSEDEKEFLYWLTYSLWQSEAFYCFLVGSVIPFIRVDEFRSFIQEKYLLAKQEHQQHQKAIRALRTLEEQEKRYLQNVALIQEAKRAVLARYVRK